MEKTTEESLSLDIMEGNRKHRLREVKICCRKCRKSFRLTYTEVGDPHMIVFRNMGFKCPRCRRERYIDRITEGALLRSASVWDAVYI